MGEERRRLRSTKGQLQNTLGDVKHSMGNGVAKELKLMTHGREQWCEDCLWEQGVLGGGGQRGKNWDNC